jgi:hypothetical protein
LATFIVTLPSLLAATTWGQWLLFVRLWLPLRGKLPWRLHAFLADARDRGALRQAGAMYRFRHSRLQDHLSSSDDETAHDDEVVTTIVRWLSRTSALAGGTTTLARLAQESGCDIATIRADLTYLVNHGLINAVRHSKPTRPGGSGTAQATSRIPGQKERDTALHDTVQESKSQPVVLDDLSVHARFTLSLR